MSTLGAELRNRTGSLSVGDNSTSISGWVVRLTTIQQKERNFVEFWDLVKT